MRAGIPALTGLRFVAAGAVFVAHALPKIIPWPQNQAESVIYTLAGSVAGEGMTLFFVLSGFVIHYNYSEQIQQQGGRGLFNFFVARFARLYPLYFFCLVFELLLKYSYSQVPESLMEVLPFYLTLTHSWFYFIAGDNSLIYQLGLIPSVAWSISTEWFFYCTYPLICYGLVSLSRPRDKLYAAVALCLIATCLVIAVGSFAAPINSYAVGRFGDIADFETHWQDSFLRWLLYFSPYMRLFEFLLGCLCASLYLDIADRTPNAAEERWGLVALAAALLITAALHIFLFAPLVLPAQTLVASLSARLHWLNLSFGLAPPIAVIIFCCARYKSALTRLLSMRRVLLCGEASYSIYLLHLVVIWAFRWEAAPVTSPRVWIGDVLRFGVTFLSVIGLSLVVWSLIEVPARRWLRRFMVPEPVVLLKSASVASLQRQN